jgi:hypothetical protein
MSTHTLSPSLCCTCRAISSTTIAGKRERDVESLFGPVVWAVYPSKPPGILTRTPRELDRSYYMYPTLVPYGLYKLLQV